MRFSKTLTLLLLSLAATAAAPYILHADVTLPSVFSEHMVLQRSAQTPVWGRAASGEKITVSLDASVSGGPAGSGTVKSTTAGADGRWRVNLDLSDAARIPAGPHRLVITAGNTLSIPDVLIGEVWLASGQSNMARTMSSSGSREEIAGSANDRLRFFTAARQTSLTPLDDVAGKWTVAAPDTTPGFSAVAYYFARQLQAELGAPVGVIHSSWGGTGVEAWTSLDALKSDPALGKIAVTEIETAGKFPEKKAAWLAALRPWLAANGREDRPTPAADLAAFTTLPASAGADGWSAVKLPGKLPGERILWVRREITVPSSAAGKPLVLDFDEIAGIDTVFLDGKPAGGRTLETFDGDGFRRLNVRRTYRVPADAVTAGRHTLAIRIYAPLGGSGINGSYFTAGSQKLGGEWLLKTERAFAPLTPAARNASPGSLKAPLRPWNVSSSLYNAMIHGLAPYGLRGFIWYQGENNAGNPGRYRTAFPLLINDWRARWADFAAAESTPPLSFYWCQLPNFQAKTDNANASPGWAGIREAQTLTLKLPRTGQAVLIDAGEPGDIHPQSKREAGARLAALALAHDYGKRVEYSGPVHDSMQVEGSAIRVRFAHVGGGLVARPVPAEYLYASVPKRVTKPLGRNSPESQLEGFLIRGAPGEKWEWADARIDGDTVVVSSPRVPKPQAVRYAWFSNPTCNLYNAAGFPACPFRTDTD
ncbi:9-O-acetylesterase [Opitutaceae bacterium TAV5]|nr:9-O-acetylesterase [Opitutaceae bacterium TAV5]